MVNWISKVPQRPDGGLIVVVDGGATHSRVAVVEAGGALRGFAKGGPTNIRSVGAEGAAANLATTVTGALADGNGGDPIDAAAVSYCLITSASIDTDEQADILSDAVRPLLASAIVSTVPDTMGCWAATNALGAAVAVISGTGSVVVAADREREIWRRFGGWDYLLGDEGSGYALGRAALQETLLVGEQRSDARALSDAVLSSPQATIDPARRIVGPDDIPDAVHQPSIDKAWIAAFAPIVLDLAGAGDEHALGIVRREVGILAKAAAAGVDVLRPVGREPAGADPTGAVPVGLFGGTFRSAVLTESFVDAVGHLTDHPIRPFVPERSALVGAFTIALGPGPDSEAANDRLDAELDERYAGS